MWSTSKKSALASKRKMSFCLNDKLQFARKDAGGFQLCTLSNKVSEQEVIFFQITFIFMFGSCMHRRSNYPFL